MFPEGYKDPVCVFCGSSPGTSIIFTKAAQAVGNAFAEEQIPMVYGGGRRGIMGVVSQSALEAGGLVHGILPRSLMARAVEHTPAPSGDVSVDTSRQNTPPAVSAEGVGNDLLNEDYGGRLTMEVVSSMHERKAKMADVSTGGFVVLPGGYGTFEELLEMVTWNQIGMHNLPVVVLNIGNFYTALHDLLENAVTSGFIMRHNLSLLQIVNLGDAEANCDESRAAEWGPAAINALKNWSLPEGAGYGFNWDDAKAPKAVKV